MNLRDFPPVEENVDQPESFRQTLLNKHDQCPRSAYLYMKYEGGKSSHRADGGTALHMTLERATNLMIDNGEPQIPGDMCREMADAVMAEATHLVLSTAEQDAVRLMAWNWAEATAFDLDKIIGAEVPLEMELCGLKITGTIDLMETYEQTIRNTDYKSGLNMKKNEEIQRDFQGKLYGLLSLIGVNSETGNGYGSGIDNIWHEQVYPRYREKDDRGKPVGSLLASYGAWERFELHEFRVSLERNLERLQESFETGDWPARDDDTWCGYCPAQTECPIPAHLRKAEEIETPEDAENAFSHKMATERESRRLAAGLRTWVDQHEAVFVGEHAYDAKPSISREVKDWEVFEAEIEGAILTGKPIKIEDFVRTKKSTRFGKRKQTKEELENADQS